MFPKVLNVLKRWPLPPTLVGLVCVLQWLGGFGMPALEDDRFWWIPQAWCVVERGFEWVPAGELPAELVPAGAPLPPQWAQGIPDFAHPPLFFWYLGGWLQAVIAAGLSGMIHPMGLVQLGLLPLVLLAGLGIFRLGRTLLPDWAAALAACVALSMPPVEAQLSRADLDLGLLAGLPWALDALLARRFWLFALLSIVLVWTKEPGVLLASAPLCFLLKHRSWTALGRAFLGGVPLLALLAWAGLHRHLEGWALASPERLAPNVLAQLNDIARVADFVLHEQGRWVLTGLVLLSALGALAQKLAWGGVFEWVRRGASRSGPFSRVEQAGMGALPVQALATRLLGLQLASWVVFFGSVNFLGGDPGRIAGGHWRYLVPVLPLLAILGVRGGLELLSWSRKGGEGGVGKAGRSWRLRGLAGAGILLMVGLPLFDRHGPPVGGVERNLFSRDLVLAHRAILPILEEKLTRGEEVWVGSYAWVELVSPRLGHPAHSLAGYAGKLHFYHPGTRPEEVPVEAWVLESAHGEPLGRLAHGLELEPVREEGVGAAWVRLYRVRGRRPA